MVPSSQQGRDVSPGGASSSAGGRGPGVRGGRGGGHLSDGRPSSGLCSSFARSFFESAQLSRALAESAQEAGANFAGSAAAANGLDDSVIAAGAMGAEIGVGVVGRIEVVEAGAALERDGDSSSEGGGGEQKSPRSPRDDGAGSSPTSVVASISLPDDHRHHRHHQHHGSEQQQLPATATSAAWPPTSQAGIEAVRNRQTSRQMSRRAIAEEDMTGTQRLDRARRTQTRASMRASIILGGRSAEDAGSNGGRSRSHLPVGGGGGRGRGGLRRAHTAIQASLIPGPPPHPPADSPLGSTRGAKGGGDSYRGTMEEVDGSSGDEPTPRKRELRSDSSVARFLGAAPPADAATAEAAAAAALAPGPSDSSQGRTDGVPVGSSSEGGAVAGSRTALRSDSSVARFLGVAPPADAATEAQARSDSRLETDGVAGNSSAGGSVQFGGPPDETNPLMASNSSIASFLATLPQEEVEELTMLVRAETRRQEAERKQSPVSRGGQPQQLPIRSVGGGGGGESGGATVATNGAGEDEGEGGEVVGQSANSSVGGTGPALRVKLARKFSEELLCAPPDIVRNISSQMMMRMGKYRELPPRAKAAAGEGDGGDGGNVDLSDTLELLEVGEPDMSRADTGSSVSSSLSLTRSLMPSAMSAWPTSGGLSGSGTVAAREGREEDSGGDGDSGDPFSSDVTCANTPAPQQKDPEGRVSWLEDLDNMLQTGLIDEASYRLFRAESMGLMAGATTGSPSFRTKSSDVAEGGGDRDSRGIEDGRGDLPPPPPEGSSRSIGQSSSTRTIFSHGLADDEIVEQYRIQARREAAERVRINVGLDVLADGLSDGMARMLRKGNSWKLRNPTGFVPRRPGMREGRALAAPEATRPPSFSKSSPPSRSSSSSASSTNSFLIEEEGGVANSLVRIPYALCPLPLHEAKDEREDGFVLRRGAGGLPSSVLLPDRELRHVQLDYRSPSLSESGNVGGRRRWEHVTRCQGCGSMLRVGRRAELVDCPECGAVGPATSVLFTPSRRGG